MALTDIAAARVLQGDSEQACQELARALDLAVNAGYWMGIERIRGGARPLSEQWVDLAFVRELDERLASVSVVSS